MSAKPLSNELARRLFELAIVLDELMERGLAERGLSRARATVLSQLHVRGPLMQRELSQTLGVTPRNVTGLVDGLEHAGLVRRQPHPHDRRATQVRLTASGRRLAAGLHADESRFGEMLFRGARSSELKTFLSTLDQVLARLHAMRSGAEEAA